VAARKRGTVVRSIGGGTGSEASEERSMGTHGAGEREDVAEASCAVGDGSAGDEQSLRGLGRIRRRFDELLVKMLGDEMDRLDPAAGSPPAGLTSATPVGVATAEEGVARWTVVNAPPTSGYRSRHRLVVPEAREASTVPESREASTVPEAREASTVPEAREASTVAEAREASTVAEAREASTVAEAREASTVAEAPSANTGPVYQARRPARHRSPPRHAAPSARLVVRFTSKEVAEPTGTDTAQAAR
jgi:hypothetical protein